MGIRDNFIDQAAEMKVIGALLQSMGDRGGDGVYATAGEARRECTVFGKPVRLEWPEGLPDGMTEDDVRRLAYEWGPKPPWIVAESETPPWLQKPPPPAVSAAAPGKKGRGKLGSSGQIT